MKLLIYDPNDQGGHRRIYFHPTQIQSDALCLSAITELQSYVMIICRRTGGRNDTLPATLFCFKLSGVSGMLPYRLSKRSEFSSPQNYNEFITKILIATICEMHLREHANVIRYLNRILSDTPALRDVVLEGPLDMVDFLVSIPTDINSKDPKTGATPLNLATQVGRVEMVKKLLHWGLTVIFLPQECLNAIN